MIKIEESYEYTVSGFVSYRFGGQPHTYRVCETEGVMTAVWVQANRSSHGSVPSQRRWIPIWPRAGSRSKPPPTAAAVIGCCQDPEQAARRGITVTKRASAPWATHLAVKRLVAIYGKDMVLRWVEAA